MKLQKKDKYKRINLANIDLSSFKVEDFLYENIIENFYFDGSLSKELLREYFCQNKESQDTMPIVALDTNLYSIEFYDENQISYADKLIAIMNSFFDKNILLACGNIESGALSRYFEYKKDFDKNKKYVAIKDDSILRLDNLSVLTTNKEVFHKIFDYDCQKSTVNLSDCIKHNKVHLEKTFDIFDCSGDFCIFIISLCIFLTYINLCTDGVIKNGEKINIVVSPQNNFFKATNIAIDMGLPINRIISNQILFDLNSDNIDLYKKNINNSNLQFQIGQIEDCFNNVFDDYGVLLCPSEISAFLDYKDDDTKIVTIILCPQSPYYFAEDILHFLDIKPSNNYENIIKQFYNESAIAVPKIIKSIIKKPMTSIDKRVCDDNFKDFQNLI